MSRLGKKPIPVPSGIEVKIEDGKVTVKGPKGEISRNFRDEISISLKENSIELGPRIKTKLSQKLWGTYASLIKNMIAGARDGFSKRLLLEGIGYRAGLEGKDLVLTLGFSHPVRFAAPSGINFQVEKNIITVFGIDKEKVGATASRLRSLKKPDPYKGKGIRYEGEVIRRKAGKKAAGATG